MYVSAQRAAEHAVADFQAQLPPGASFTVESINTLPFVGRASFGKLALSLPAADGGPPITLKAESLTITTRGGKPSAVEAADITLLVDAARPPSSEDVAAAGFDAATGRVQISGDSSGPIFVNRIRLSGAGLPDLLARGDTGSGTVSVEMLDLRKQWKDVVAAEISAQRIAFDLETGQILRRIEITGPALTFAADFMGEDARFSAESARMERLNFRDLRAMRWSGAGEYPGPNVISVLCQSGGAEVRNVTSVSPGREPLTIESITITDNATRGSRVRDVTFRATKLFRPHEERRRESFTSFNERMGMNLPVDGMRASSEARLRFDPETRIAAVDPMELDFDGLFRVRLRLRLAGIPPDERVYLLMISRAFQDRVELVAADFDFFDNGILRDASRSEIGAYVPEVLMASYGSFFAHDQASRRRFEQELQRAISETGFLGFRVRPSRPARLGTLLEQVQRRNSTAIRFLNITPTATPPAPR
jgi:hypothetical protein